MKKIFILVVLALFNFGCANEKGVDTNVEEPIEIADKMTKQEQKEESNEEDEMVVDKPLQEEEQVEKPQFVLQSDYTVKPIDPEEDDKVVLLTFDDAPDQYSVEIATLLKEMNINAIFFMNGHFLKQPEGEEKLKTIFDMGFEIGNHTMTHQNLSHLTADEQEKEIVELNDNIEEIIGIRPRFFRAPFGVNTDVSKKVVVEVEKMQAMNWTYGYDYFKEYMNKESLAEIMVNTNLLVPGANLLMHDRKWTVEALPEIIKGLEQKGYSFVDPKKIQ